MQRESSNSKERILVIGAGELGLAVLQALAARSAETAGITVLLRQATAQATSGQKRQDIELIQSLGIAIETADVSTASVAELADVMKRFDTVISCVGFAGGRGTQLKLTDAALRSGVQRYFPWQFGVDYDLIGRGSPQDLFDEQLDVRDRLRAQSHTAWVIVSVGMFTSFLFEPAFGVVDLAAGRVNALGSLQNRVTLTTPEDIGRLTAGIVLQRPPIMNEVVRVAGDTISYEELAALLERVIGRPIERHVLTEAQLLSDLAAAPDDTMRKYRAVFAQGIGVAWDPQTTYNAARAIPLTTATQWATLNLPNPH